MSEEWTDELDRHRFTRAGAWLLLFVGIVGAGLGFMAMRGNILNAFETDTEPFKSSEEIEQELVEASKTKDTDNDGISDYDETYVFKTSPYLDDSDSDGLSDKQELESGKNPNCPEGRNCGVLGDEAETTASATSSTDTASAEDAYLQSLLNPTPDQVRAYLMEAGVSEEELKQFDDDALVRMYMEALGEAQKEQEDTEASQ